MRQVHFPTPALDAAIIKLYRSRIRRGEVKAFALRWGKPRWWISQRALDIAAVAPKTKNPNWTPKELEILERNHWKHLKTIQLALRRQGFRRTTTAISMRRKLEGHRLEDAPFLTANSLASLCGVDEQTVIRTWIGKEGLTANRRGTSRTAEQGDHHWIPLKDFRAWVSENRHRVDLRKVNQVWFYEYVIFNTSRHAAKEPA